MNFDNRATLKAMSDAAKAGTPGLETHPDYVPRVTDADRIARAKRIQGAAMERAFPGCGPVDGSDL
jgi:hypothetical protein